MENSNEWNRFLNDLSKLNTFAGFWAASLCFTSGLLLLSLIIVLVPSAYFVDVNSAIKHVASSICHFSLATVPAALLGYYVETELKEGGLRELKWAARKFADDEKNNESSDPKYQICFRYLAWSCILTIAYSLLTEVNLWVALAITLIVNYVKYATLRAPNNWAAYIDKMLCTYIPEDAQSLKYLQDSTRRSSQYHANELNSWLTKEQEAINKRKIAILKSRKRWRKTQDRPNFIDREL